MEEIQMLFLFLCLLSLLKWCFPNFTILYFLLRCSFVPTSALVIAKHCHVSWLYVCESDCVCEPWAIILHCPPSLPLHPSPPFPFLLFVLWLQAEKLLICVRNLSLLLISSVYFPTYYLTLKNKQILTDSQCPLPPSRWSLRGCEINFFHTIIKWMDKRYETSGHFGKHLWHMH